MKTNFIEFYSTLRSWGISIKTSIEWANDYVKQANDLEYLKLPSMEAMEEALKNYNPMKAMEDCIKFIEMGRKELHNLRVVS